MRPLLFCLMGPTAAGKTDLACELVQRFPFEIISVDSAMVYRDMNIGTAKPSAKTLAEAPHHLIDILDPPDPYSAALFCKDIATISERIFNHGKIPLLVGGTMMYFRALQQGLSNLPEADAEIREQLLQQANTHGWAYMHETLARVDKATAARIHPNDSQRIQRALEVYQLSKQPLSAFLSAAKEAVHYQFVNILLMPDNRAWLHQRIEHRFRHMLETGFIEEVEGLLQKWALTEAHPSMRSVGYRQVMNYLRGEIDVATLSEQGIAATRQLAKRQLTWLRHWPEGHIVAADMPTSAHQIMVIIQQILDNGAVG